jgi:hypothetical protein
MKIDGRDTGAARQAGGSASLSLRVSSIMRRRNGLMASSVMGMLLS